MTARKKGANCGSGGAPVEPRKTRIQAINEKRILNAAQEVFAHYGYHGATIDGIADKAEMSKPNLHYYFKTKKDLYNAVLKRTLEHWLAPLSELDPAGDPAEELRSYIAEKVEMSRKNPTASRLFASEILQGAPFVKDYLRKELKELVDRKASVLRGWVAEGRLADVDPYHLIFLIWAATQHYADFAPQVRLVTGTARMNKAHFKQVEESLCSIILNGVLPPRTT